MPEVPMRILGFDREVLPSEAIRMVQDKQRSAYGYLHDDYEIVHMKKGEKILIMRGGDQDPQSGMYLIPEEDFQVLLNEKNEFDAKEAYDRYQVQYGEIDGTHTPFNCYDKVYEITLQEDICVISGICEANQAFGKGGGVQVVVNDLEMEIERGTLSEPALTEYQALNTEVTQEEFEDQQEKASAVQIQKSQEVQYVESREVEEKAESSNIRTDMDIGLGDAPAPMNLHEEEKASSPVQHDAKPEADSTHDKPDVQDRDPKDASAEKKQELKEESPSVSKAAPSPMDDISPGEHKGHSQTMKGIEPESEAKSASHNTMNDIAPPESKKDKEKQTNKAMNDVAPVSDKSKEAAAAPEQSLSQSL